MIKVIATDMDGTFLNSEKEYDRNHFNQLFKRMQKQNIKFVVASGNQYAQLVSFFPGKEDLITFVSDNGTQIFEQKKLLHATVLDIGLVQDIIKFGLEHDKVKHMTLTGVRSAYMEKRSTPEQKAYSRQYYYNLTEIETFNKLPNDDFNKFNFVVPDEIKEVITEELNSTFAGKIHAVTSGHESIDIISPAANKAVGIKYLLENWNISASELLAFGDQNNDLEMLKFAGHGYAMENGSPEVLAATPLRAKDSDHNGVLNVIDELID